ncbi:Hypothetical_protein [Hexamita inflata]|uniref:Hypothetical_protein n=1 Tax=Hexamita inflata TaxID=28002 RepID=A0AA86RRS9_9EUKA|nr:Hypothetical protein HINF_LOCUS64494 [Hexamita inflata]
MILNCDQYQGSIIPSSMLVTLLTSEATSEEIASNQNQYGLLFNIYYTILEGKVRKRMTSMNIIWSIHMAGMWDQTDFYNNGKYQLSKHAIKINHKNQNSLRNYQSVTFQSGNYSLL